MHTRLRIRRIRRHVRVLDVEDPDGGLASQVTEIYTRWVCETVDAPCRFAHLDRRCAQTGGVCPKVKTRVTQHTWGSETSYPEGRGDPPDCGSRELPEEAPMRDDDKCGGQLTFPGTCHSPHHGVRCHVPTLPACATQHYRQFIFVEAPRPTTIRIAGAVRQPPLRSASVFEYSCRQAWALAALILNLPKSRVYEVLPTTDGFRPTEVLPEYYEYAYGLRRPES